MRLICVSGLDGSGKTSLVEGITSTFDLPVLPRLSDDKKACIAAMKKANTPLHEIATTYLDGMLEIYQAYKTSTELMIADRWLVDLFAMMQANHVLNGVPMTDFDLSTLERPVAAIFLDCHDDDRQKRFLREGRVIEHFDALSVQEGCSDVFRKYLTEKYALIGVPEDRFCRINGTYFDADYVVEQALHFLKPIIAAERGRVAGYAHPSAKEYMAALTL